MPPYKETATPNQHSPEFPICVSHFTAFLHHSNLSFCLEGAEKEENPPKHPF